MRVEWLCTLILFSSPAFARGRREALPDSAVVLASALSDPATGYQGVGRIQIFMPGKKAKGIGFSQWVLPGGRYRRDIRKGKKTVAAVIDDGKNRTVMVYKVKELWSGAMEPESLENRMNRIRTLYDVEITTGGHVAKRPTWRLNLRRKNGAVELSIWTDRVYGIVMKREVYRASGELSRRERFTKWSGSSPSPDTFRPESETGWTALALNTPSGVAPGVGIPRWLPEDYFPLSARQDGGMWTLEYGNGVETLSVRGKQVIGARTLEEQARVENGLR